MGFSGFLHGIEVIESTVGPLPVTVVRSGVIGLVGTYPSWAAPTRPNWYTPPADATVPGFLAGDSLLAAFPLWNQSAVYVVGDCVIDDNGNVQQATDAGTSGTSLPSFATTLGATTVDGGVIWTLKQLAPTLKEVNQLVLVSGVSDAGGFGPRVRGYTIPYALRQIMLQGAAQVIVVNVFDRNVHKTAVTAEVHTLPASGVQKLSLGHMGVANIKVTDTPATTTYVAGTDFTVDLVNGIVFKKTGGAIADNQSLKITYDYADPAGAAGVVDADVEGDIGPPATGFELLPFSMSAFGFTPKILIAPGFSHVQAVAVEMVAIASRLRSIAVIDSPGGVAPVGGGSDAPEVSQTAKVQTPNVSDTIANRSDTAEAFGLADERAILLYPNMMFTDDGDDPAGATIFNPVDGPYSAWWAGACAANDIKRGYWDSPSNIVINGPLGPDVQFVMSAKDPTSDSNNLNAAGIVTVFSAFGTGLRAWGNHSSAFPASTDPKTFIAIRRVLDVVDDSLEIFSLQFLDRPINNALIDLILDSVNAFIGELIGRGALIAGSRISFDPTANPPASLAAGKLRFAVNLMPPPPAERIEYDFFVDITLLKNITGAA